MLSHSLTISSYTFCLGLQILGIVSASPDTLLGSSFGVPNVPRAFDYLVRSLHSRSDQDAETYDIDTMERSLGEVLLDSP